VTPAAALRWWREGLIVVLVLALPAAMQIGRWQGEASATARLRAEAAETRLRQIEDERTRRDEIQTLAPDDLRRRLDRWLRE
jgi:anti-sigma-K factor RskA